MMNNVKTFAPGIAFESNTTYVADRKEYHIYPTDKTGVISGKGENPHGGAKGVTDVAFYMKNVENVTVDLGGAAIILHGRLMPFYAIGCKNVTLKNFSVDYDRPYFTQGTVSEVKPGSLVMDIPEEFGYRIERGEFIATSEFWENSMASGSSLMQPYDPATGRLSKSTGFVLGVIGDEVVPQENPPCPVYHLRAEQLEGRKVRLTGFPDFYQPYEGDVLAFTHEGRDKSGFHFQECTDSVFENIRLLHVSAMAFVGNFCHNLTFRNFSCYTDEKSKGRIIAVNADVLHGYHCTGKILVEDCRFENMLDDALNFHGEYTTFEKQIDAHTIVSLNKGVSRDYMPMYLPGDIVYVYNGSTIELKAVYTVESAVYFDDDSHRQTIVFREEIHDFAEGDLIDPQRMPEIVVRRCTSGFCRGGWRFSSDRPILMEDCRIENSHIMFTGDTNYWYENTGVRDMTIRNCVFENFDGAPLLSCPIFESTEKAPYYQSGIKILNNRFVDCRGEIMNFQYTTDVEFRGNTFIDDGKAPHTFVLKNCGKVNISD